MLQLFRKTVRRPAADVLKEALVLLMSIAMAHGYRSGHVHSLQYLPASPEHPGGAGITVEIEKPRTLKIFVISADPSDLRWDAAEAVVRALIDTIDPDLEELKVAPMETGAEAHIYTTLRTDWITYYRFLKQAKNDSAHDGMEAPVKLEALLVSAGLARRKAIELIVPLTADPHLEAA